MALKQIYEKHDITSFQLAYILGKHGVEKRQKLKSSANIHKVAKNCYLSITAGIVKTLEFDEGDRIKFEVADRNEKTIKLTLVEEV